MMIYQEEPSFRTRDYVETLDILNQFKKLVGITRLADLTHLDYTGLPVYTAIRPRAKSLTTSQGKGLTISAAKCSALMESIEVYFAEELVPEVINKSEVDLTQEKIPFIPLNHLAKSVCYLNQLQKISWVNAKLLLSGNTVLAPFAEYSLNSYLEEVLVYSPDTTGLAGGNNFKEALLHGILEVIERQSTENEVEIINIENALYKKIIQLFECRINYKENIYGIPSFEVLLKSKNPFENQILFKGNGCHLNKKIALNRALSEAIQSRVTTIAGSRDDIVDTKYDTENIQFPSGINKKEFDDLLDCSIETIDEALPFLYEKIQQSNQDIMIYTYYDKEICILKVKLISIGLISNV